MNSQTNYKRFFIHTLGCKVNQYESQAMREILLKAGYKECLSKEIADIYVLNTCTVTHHADRESRHWIGVFHRTNPAAKIVVTGCYTENDSDDISFLPGVSHVLKNSEKNRIADILNDPTSLTRLDSGHATRSNLVRDSLAITRFEGHTRAFVKIQDGCENNCAYCKVPLVRPSLKSKHITDIADEVGTLVNNGYKEIVLVGICLGAWGKDLFPNNIAKYSGLGELTLADVLKTIDKIGGGFRVRLSSIEPRYITDELLELMSKTDRICRHLHIPLQSGDDDVLKKMNRPYSTDEYRSLVWKARSMVKNIAITTDLMVGFPGESEKSFQNTLSFIKEITPARAHIFTYSRRKGTSAYDMTDEVGDNAARWRHQMLNTITLMTSCVYRSNFLGQALKVLVETKRDRQSGMLTGYSDNYIKMLFEGPDDLMGTIVPVIVEDLTLMHTLGGQFSR